MKRTRLLFTLVQVILDTAILTLAFTVAYYLRDTYDLLPSEAWRKVAEGLRYDPTTGLLDFGSYYRYVQLIIPGMVAISAISGLYRIPVHARWWERLGKVFLSVTVGSFFILFLFFLRKDFFLPRLLIIYSWVLSLVGVYVSHSVLHGIQRLLYRFDITTTRLAVIGKNRNSQRVIRELTGAADSAYTLAWNGPADTPLGEIEKALLGTRSQELVVVEDKGNEHLIALRNICLEHQMAFRYIPMLFTQLPSTYAVFSVRDLPMIEVRPTPLDGWRQIYKRLFDIAVGILLLILASPLFLVIAASIKLTSPGPIFFAHKRIGRHKRIIRTWKFRTFRSEFCDGLNPDYKERFQEMLDSDPDLADEWERDHKLKNDPRVFPLGRLLRKTSLDELPQFFNVVAGSLSLVGPRPIVDDEVDKYGERAKILFSVKPGLTGLWQVSGRNDVSYEDRVRMDMHYIEHWNILWDLVIITKTFWVILFARKQGGAY